MVGFFISQPCYIQVDCYIKKELTFYLFFLFSESEDDLDEEDLALIQENTGIKLEKVCILVRLCSCNVESDVASSLSIIFMVAHCSFVCSSCLVQDILLHQFLVLLLKVSFISCKEVTKCSNVQKDKMN